jgi:hypothetical protein
MADCLLLVTPIPEIVARDPRTGGAIGKAPIAEMEAAFDRAEIGLGAWRQRASLESRYLSNTRRAMFRILKTACGLMPNEYPIYGA